MKTGNRKPGKTEHFRRSVCFVANSGEVHTIAAEMPIEFIEHNSGKDVEIIATGKLEASDYDSFVPRFDFLIEKYGSIDVLFVMRDFEGFEMWALWEDIKLEWEHYSDIGRLAMVGETSWEKWMSLFCKPFTKSEVKYFDSAEIDDARAWLVEDVS